jgi:hypothetical protein
VRNSTLHCGTHPWDIKTTIFSFPRPETSHGWDPDTKVDRSLQTLVHNTTYARYTVSYAFSLPCSRKWRRRRRLLSVPRRFRRLDKAFHNTSRKGEKYFTSYKTLQQQFSGHHVRSLQAPGVRISTGCARSERR